MLLCCITLSSSRENQRMLKRQQEGFLAPLLGRSTPSQDIPSTHHKSYTSHYIICHFPLVFLSPTSPLPFYSPSFHCALSFRSLFLRLFAFVLDCLLVTMAQDNTKLCDFANTNNNDFISTAIAPLTDAESCEINTALLNLVMKDPFSGLPSTTKKKTHP